MLGVLLSLSFVHLVTQAAPPTGSPVPCKRCCDDLQPAEDSAAPPAAGEYIQLPQVRAYINMTILKGTPAEPRFHRFTFPRF